MKPGANPNRSGDGLRLPNNWHHLDRKESERSLSSNDPLLPVRQADAGDGLPQHLSLANATPLTGPSQQFVDAARAVQPLSSGPGAAVPRELVGQNPDGAVIVTVGGSPAPKAPQASPARSCATATLVLLGASLGAATTLLGVSLRPVDTAHSQGIGALMLVGSVLLCGIWALVSPAFDPRYPGAEDRR